MTLAEFIEARLGDEQANAEQALALWPDTHFTVDPGSLVIVRFQREHDPERVLRQVAAMRAILDLHQCEKNIRGIDTCTYTDNRDRWPCPEVRHLAAIWADHPDYQQEWTCSHDTG